MMDILSFHNNAAQHQALVNAGIRHRNADMIAKGSYEKNYQGRACTAGCYADGPEYYDRVKFCTDRNLPVRLIGIVDTIFEGLPSPEHTEWHIQWTQALPIGVPIANLETVCDKLIRFACLRKAEIYGSEHRQHLDAVIALYDRRIAGDEPSDVEWSKAALAALDALDARDARAALAARAARAARAALDALDALDARDGFYRAVRDEYLLLMSEVSSEGGEA